MDRTYHILNVFTDGHDPFSGNGVCVFEDGRGLSEDQMQAIAAQVNDETVFIMPTDAESGADVCFFSPEKQTGFAGSASLATAAVLRAMLGGAGAVTLTDATADASYVVRQEQDQWVLGDIPVTAEPLKATPHILASLVDLSMEAVGGEVMTVNGGKAGIVLPVRSIDDVRKTRLDARLLHSYAMLLDVNPRVYVWANVHDEPETIDSRMFYGPRGGVLEVAATGTGGAGLGAWFAAQGRVGIHRRVIQGRSLGRRSELDLWVDEDGSVRIGGRTHEVATGVFSLSDPE